MPRTEPWSVVYKTNGLLAVLSAQTHIPVLSGNVPWSSSAEIKLIGIKAYRICSIDKNDAISGILYLSDVTEDYNVSSSNNDNWIVNKFQGKLFSKMF